MHCSSSEALLDAYLEEELGPVERGRVQRHLAICPHCTAILTELRVIDALLLTPRQLESAPNFTFKVMAEVRATPQPRAHRQSPWPILGAYVVFGWVAIAAFLFLGGAGARAMLASIQTALLHFAAGLGALSAATGHLFGHQTFDVTAAMGGILALDLLVAAGGLFFYSALRARRRAAQGEF